MWGHVVSCGRGSFVICLTVLCCLVVWLFFVLFCCFSFLCKCICKCIYVCVSSCICILRV